MTRSPNAQLAWLSLAMFLGMTLWFSATAANAPIVAEFHLASSQTAWLTMAVQGGFVIGTLISALVNLPDVINPRRLFAIGCVIAAARQRRAGARRTASLMLVALRVATGAALAWVYPPGMKIAAGWFEQRRGAALGVLIGALTIGSAFPHLLASASATIPWRMLMLVGVGAGAARRRDRRDRCRATDRMSRAARDSIRRRSAASSPIGGRASRRSATSGTCGSSTRCGPGSPRSRRRASGSCGGATPSSPSGSAVAFATIGSGAIGSAAAGWFADRIGKARIASWAMIVSGPCCAAAGFLFHAPRAAALPVRDHLGRGGGRRLGAAVGPGRAVQPARSRRHRVDASRPASGFC